MSEGNDNSGFIFNGGDFDGNNFSVGNHVKQEISNTGSSDAAMEKALKLIEQIRDSLSAEPDSALRDDIAERLDDAEDALSSQSSSGTSAWRRRLDRISGAVGRLGERATSLTEPLGQLAAAVATIAGIAGH
jgi:hypothetical protein